MIDLTLDKEEWKRDATSVIVRWERAYEALPDAVREDPRNLGRFKSDIVTEYVWKTQLGDADSG